MRGENIDHFVFIPKLAELLKLRNRKNVVSNFTAISLYLLSL